MRFVTLRGLTFRHAARTFMDTKEPLLRSDWTIYRGGAVFFNGAEDCALEDCFLDQVGGNAVFVNNYNRRVTVRGCHIAKAGANGVCFVGDPQAARNPLFNYSQVNRLEDLDRTPGPQTNNYPADCLVEDCLIYLTGRVEKQTAGVQISTSPRASPSATARSTTCRAPASTSATAAGADTSIEFCDVFDTVKETGDHGSFNSWGRDRFWRPNIDEVNAWVQQVPELPLLDAVKPVILRNNRWRCDHGWDIDLDDGSSNYIITNNLCLHGGIKNREGFGRVVENNIMVNTGFHPHVWYAAQRRHLPAQHRLARLPARPDARRRRGARRWTTTWCTTTARRAAPATRLQQQSGRDEHSIVADAQFVDPASGDYRVKDGSPALTLGFVNFPMDQFGVQKPELKAIARTPVLPGQRPAAAAPVARDTTPRAWLGASVRNIADEGEMSAFGLPGVTGVLVLEVPAGSALAKAGLQKNDVILSVNGTRTADVAALLQQAPALTAGQTVPVAIWRNQKESTLMLTP